MTRIRFSRTLGIAGAAIAITALAACSQGSGSVTSPSATGAAGPMFDRAETGNGAPSGAHYTLNMIGVNEHWNGNANGANVMFVPLVGRTKIELTEGDFAVLDSDGTDGTAAFRLPNPDPDNDGITEYSVFARALGIPGGTGFLQTCADDTAGPGGTEYCSVVGQVEVRRGNGRVSKFQNVSRELLYVYVDLDGDGTPERYPLFDDALEDYYWYYDNEGNKLLQLRFYAVPTDVN